MELLWQQDGEMIEFGEFLPDLPPLANPGLIQAQNVLPGEANYLPLPGPMPFSPSPFDGVPSGYISTRDNGIPAISYTFVGTPTSIFQNDGPDYTNVSRATAYATTSKNSWEFTQWGNDIIATNFDDLMQVITMGSPPFADLAGSPPRAKHVATVQNFLVVGNTNDPIDGNQPQRVRWAGIGTTTSWSVDPATQADFQDLRNNGGQIQKIVGGEYGLILQEKSIVKMYYVGAPLVFQFDLLEDNRGCIAPNSVVKVGNNIAYLADDGFYVFDGQQSIPISEGKIVDTFFRDLNRGYLNRISVALYPRQNIICWSYVSLFAQVEGMPDTILFYNYAPNSKTRWAFASINSYLLLNPISIAYTLDGLDAVSTNLDTGIIFSLDDPIWMGELDSLGTIDQNLFINIMEGDALPAIISTGEAWLKQPNRTYISLIRPHIDSSEGIVSVQIGSRNNESEDISYGATYSMNVAGNFPVRANSRFLSAKFRITGNFFGAQGFDILDSTQAGIR